MDGESFTQGEPLPVLESEVVRFVCISDTHNDDCRDAIPDGDILLHAGDLTDFGDLEELQRAVDWLMALPHRLKVVIAGRWLALLVCPCLRSAITRIDSRSH